MLWGLVASTGMTLADDISAGQRIYRDGLLPSGKPLTALVAGDVPMLGTQFSCQSCHGRSGMGSLEGNYIVPPIAGQFLFAASPQPKRPAYDEKSLARVLESGVTPSGRTLDPLMPRFVLSEQEVAALTAYLRTLSARNSPGVDQKVIRFATVITDDVTGDEREAVMRILNTYAANKNRKTRLDDQRIDRGYTPDSKLPTVFREWKIDEWRLTGPVDTWNAQLEAYYRKAPVFVLLGGISHQSWGPMDRFCERHEIPCLFPSTDLPETRSGDFYTLHFSEGLYLDVELIARDLLDRDRHSTKDQKVLQISCSANGRMAAHRLHSELDTHRIKLEDLEFDCEHDAPSKLAESLKARKNDTLILWLDRKGLDRVKPVLPQQATLYLSSTLLNRDLEGLAFPETDQVLIAHPYHLPGQMDSAMRRFQLWARLRHIPVTHPRYQSEAFFACLTINDVLKHMGRFFIRGFVLDMLDHAQGLAAYVPLYPQPSFGPGQRFLAKGGYLLPIHQGQPQTRDARWITP